MTITEHNNNFIIRFEYRPRILEAVRRLPERRFDPRDKSWSVPVAAKEDVLTFAERFGFAFTNEESLLNALPMDLTIPAMPELMIDIPLKGTMFPYQGQGVAYNLIHERTLIGDQPGLGKTLQAIATMIAAGAKCILVICPASLRFNWQKEFENWSNLKCMILNDGVKSTFLNYYRAGFVQVFIVNYESLKKYFVHSIDIPPKQKLKLTHIKFKECINAFDGVVIDESHRCKDGSTQQTKFTMGICRGKKYVLCLTGTPVVNKPKDLISQLHILGRLQDFGGYKEFVQRYCNGNVAPYYSNLRELNARLTQTCFYRREKKDVLKDLPAKIREYVRVDITNRGVYDQAEKEFVNYLRDQGCSDAEIRKKLRGEIMVKIGVLKKLSAQGKTTAAIEQIGQVIDSGEKVVLFIHHKEIAEAILKAFPGAASIRGGDDMNARDKAVYEFQKCKKCGVKLEHHSSQDHEHIKSDTQLIVCSIKAAGVGITLTASSFVMFLEYPWHGADCDQCEDRTHRISQLESVMARYLLGINTIDKWCYDIIQTKREIADSVTGSTEQIEENIVDSIFNLFNQKAA